MKFGIIVHKSTQNFGDDIQSYAAAALLPHIDYIIDREHLADFKSDNGEKVYVIMSHWYAWHKFNWPPSEYIVPLFVGFHYTNNTANLFNIIPMKTEFISGIGKEYLKGYEPVGCRDSHTCNFLSDLGVDTYFSGCITLTLPKMEIHEKEQRRYICAVDLDEKVVKKLKNALENTEIELVEVTHHVDYRYSDADWNERADVVREKLTIYQNAMCVFTRRLHCMLPCFAMEVPVVFIADDGINWSRFQPYDEWGVMIERDDFIKEDYVVNLNVPARNEQAWKVRKQLLDRVENFIKGNIESDNTVFETEEINKWRNGVICEIVDKWLKKENVSIEFLEEQEKISNKFKNYYNVLDKFVSIKENGKSIADYLIKNNKKNVAIYGFGTLGKHLYNDISKNKEIKIECIIDQMAKCEDIEILIYTKTDLIPENVDIVIVTPISEYEDIAKNAGDERFVSLAAVIDRTYKLYNLGKR